MQSRRQDQHHGRQSLFESLEPRQMLDARPDDRHEPNDSVAEVNSAVEAALNSPRLGTIASSVTIRSLRLFDNADWFRFRLINTADASHFAQIAFDQTRGDLDLALIAANGTTVRRRSATSDPVETINFSGLLAGTYFLRVTGKNGATNPLYRLTINGPAAPQANEDAYEENDTFEQVNARTPGATNSPNLGGVQAGQFLVGLKLADAIDLFKFTSAGPTSGGPSFIRIDSTAALNLVLYNAAAVPVATADAYLGQSRIDMTNLPAGDYYLQVNHYAFGRPGVFNYALTFG